MTGKTLKKGSRCTICKSKNEKNKAVVFLPHHRLALCKKHYLEWFERRVAKTIKDFKMFNKNEKILVAVSGGKDSLVLWNVLNNLGYETEGMYIDLGIDEYSEDSKKLSVNFSNKINKKLNIVSIREEVASIPDIDKLTNKPACSACGTVKRYYMNKYAKNLGFQVIATGHNLDDETAVLFGNTLHWDLKYLKKQYPVLKEENGFIRKVKPLCKITEKETALYAFFTDIEYIEYECPFSEGASSIEYKEILSKIEEKHPGTKLQFYSNFVKSIYPILSEYDKKQSEEIKLCKKCGEPSFNEICSFCRLKELVNIGNTNN
ncbi:TIGR00269 family protein [Persephonella sp.]